MCVVTYLLLTHRRSHIFSEVVFVKKKNNLPLGHTMLCILNWATDVFDKAQNLWQKTPHAR